jgi:hypothetical protein
MSRKDNLGRHRRRDVLRHLGGATVLTVGAVETAVAASGETRTIEVETADFAGLNTVRVEVFETGRVRSHMSGTVLPGDPDREWQLKVTGGGSDGHTTPQNAEVTLEEVSPIPDDEFVGTNDHDGGDGESDHEGSVYLRTENWCTTSNYETRNTQSCIWDDYGCVGWIDQDDSITMNLDTDYDWTRSYQENDTTTTEGCAHANAFDEDRFKSQSYDVSVEHTHELVGRSDGSMDWNAWWDRDNDGCLTHYAGSKSEAVFH